MVNINAETLSKELSATAPNKTSATAEHLTPADNLFWWSQTICSHRPARQHPQCWPPSPVAAAATCHYSTQLPAMANVHRTGMLWQLSADPCAVVDLRSCLMTWPRRFIRSSHSTAAVLRAMLRAAPGPVALNSVPYPVRVRGGPAA